MNLSFWLGEKECEIRLEQKTTHRLEARIGDHVYDVEEEWLGREKLLLKVEGKVFNIVITTHATGYQVFVNGRSFRLERKLSAGRLKEEKSRLKKRDVKLIMPGRVIQVLVTEGERVAEGQPVLIVEAMKMQNEIKSPQSGRITRLHFSAGDYVEAGSILFSVE